METIIAEPRSKSESKAILDFLKKMNVRANVYNEPSKTHILKSIEQGAKETSLYINGKVNLKEAKELLNEL
ncbi:MAG: hypothetical protein ABIN25_08650 [Ginsengibacter sp.]